MVQIPAEALEIYNLWPPNSHVPKHQRRQQESIGTWGLFSWLPRYAMPQLRQPHKKNHCLVGTYALAHHKKKSVHICLFSRHRCGTDFHRINCGAVAPVAWQDVACNQAGSQFSMDASSSCTVKKIQGVTSSAFLLGGTSKLLSVHSDFVRKQFRFQIKIG